MVVASDQAELVPLQNLDADDRSLVLSSFSHIWLF